MRFWARMNKRSRFGSPSYAAMWALMFFGGTFRFLRLGHHSLWLDEVLSANDVSLPLHQMVGSILASPPLFHLVAKPFYLHFGFDDFWLRVPSAIFGLLTIPAFYLMVESFLDKKAASWGTLLLVLSPFHIVYSQELRMYSLVALEALGTIYFLEHAVGKNDWRNWSLYALVASMGMYTHNWFPLLVLCQFAGFSITRLSKNQTVARGIIIFSIIAFVYLPWLPFLKIQMERPVYGFLLPPGWRDVLETLYAFAGIRIPSGVSWIGVGRDARLPILTIFCALLVYGLMRRGGDHGRTLRIFFYSGLLPLALAFLISIFVKPIYHSSRYTIIAFPAFLFALSRAFQDSDGWVWGGSRLCAVAWVICLGVRPIHHYFIDYQKAPSKEMANYIKANRGSTDKVIFSGLSSDDAYAMRYYLRSEKFEDQASPEAMGSRIFMPTTSKTLPSQWLDKCSVQEDKDFFGGRVVVFKC